MFEYGFMVNPDQMVYFAGITLAVMANVYAFAGFMSMKKPINPTPCVCIECIK